MRRSHQTTQRKNRTTRWSRLDQLRMLVISKSRIAYKLKDMVSAMRKTLLNSRS
jgi:hypothetical protein